VEQGFVSNLTRPGGNLTGFSMYELAVDGKWRDLLKEIAPSLTRVGLWRFVAGTRVSNLPPLWCRCNSQPYRA